MNTFSWCILRTLAASSVPAEQGCTGGNGIPHSRELSGNSQYHQLPHTGHLEGDDLGVPRIGPVHLEMRKGQRLQSPLPVGSALSPPPVGSVLSPPPVGSVLSPPPVGSVVSVLPTGGGDSVVSVLSPPPVGSVVSACTVPSPPLPLHHLHTSPVSRRMGLG